MSMLCNPTLLYISSLRATKQGKLKHQTDKSIRISRTPGSTTATPANHMLCYAAAALKDNSSPAFLPAAQ